MTSLANEYTRASMGAASYCDDQRSLFDLASAIDPRDLAAFAAERATLHPQFVPPRSCAAAPGASVQQRVPAAKTPQ